MNSILMMGIAGLSLGVAMMGFLVKWPPRYQRAWVAVSFALQCQGLGSIGNALLDPGPVSDILSYTFLGAEWLFVLVAIVSFVRERRQALVKKPL